MSAGERIAIFVDYENIRMGLKKNYGLDAEPATIAKALKTSIEEYGEMLLISAINSFH